MSNPSTGRSYYKSDNPDISAHLNLELTKYAKTKLLDEGYDFVFFDPTSDFAGDFWENNGCIINDFTNGLMGTGWSWPDEFDISKWNKIPSKSMHYIEIYIKYLGEFISLMEANGISVICIKRKLCSEVITDAGIVGLGDAEVSDINWWIEALWREIDALALGMRVLELNSRLSLTAKDAPYGCGWFHPFEEFYDYAGYKLLYSMGVSDDLVSDIAREWYVERVCRRQAAIRREEISTTEQDRLKATLDQLLSDRDMLAAHHDASRAAIGSLVAERDGLQVALQVAEHQVADLRCAQQALQLEQDRAAAAYVVTRAGLAKGSFIRWLIDSRIPLITTHAVARISKKLRQCGFDEEYYLAHNPDVRAANANPLAHYVRYGSLERRFCRYSGDRGDHI